MPVVYILCLLSLLCWPSSALAQTRAAADDVPITSAQMQALQDGEWISYRDAYRSMLRFEKYGKPKHLLQSQFQLVPKNKVVAKDDVRLSLVGKATQINLSLDASLRTTFPLLKAAYDENAVLLLNRKIDGYRFQARVSIAPRADGVYDLAELRNACAQWYAYQDTVEASVLQGKKCTGVVFSYPKNAQTTDVKFRTGERDARLLPGSKGPVFPQDADDSFPLVVYRFADWPEKGHIITQAAPLAIAAMVE